MRQPSAVPAPRFAMRVQTSAKNIPWIIVKIVLKPAEDARKSVARWQASMPDVPGS